MEEIVFPMTNNIIWIIWVKLPFGRSEGQAAYSTTGQQVEEYAIFLSTII